MMKPTKICFVSLYAYSLFNTRTRFLFGGSEFRAHQFAIGLVKHPDIDLSFVVFDHDQPRVEHFGGVSVYSHPGYRRVPGGALSPENFERMKRYLEKRPRFPFVRIKSWHPRALANIAVFAWAYFGLRLFRAIHVAYWDLSEETRSSFIGSYRITDDKIAIYRTINADLYVGFGVSEITAEIASFCQSAGKKFVLFAGSDYDFTEKAYAKGSTAQNIYGTPGHLGYYAIMHADLILTQTDAQAILLRERFGRDSVTIRNPIDLTTHVASSNPQGATLPAGRFALWIGKSDQVKRPELLLELAVACPQAPFLMVMNYSNPVIHDQILLNIPANVQVVERVPPDEIEMLFARAIALVNTSTFEGFPNTFLQAGKYGVPILSLAVDPDGFIRQYECGIVAEGDVHVLAEALAHIEAYPTLARKLSENVRAYTSNHHDLQQITKQLAAVLNAVLEGEE